MNKISITALLMILLCTTVGSLAMSKGDRVWTCVDARYVQPSADLRVVKPEWFEAFQLDSKGLTRLLSGAPEEFTEEKELLITLPMPDGSLARFKVEHSLVVEPGLLDKFPELAATYRGYGIDDPTARVRFDLMPSGFHAMILRAGTTAFIDPSGTDGIYLAYEKTALPPREEPFVCHTNETDITDMLMTSDVSAIAAPEVSNGATLRTYRLALAATGEYTAFTGGTVSTALAAQVVSMNRVNGVYERDLSIHMNLVANNNLIIYTNAATDPYTNGNGSTMLGQNQTNLNTVIGSANYDIGHVFSTGGGGVANLNVPCTTSKARGVTGSSAPVGDGYDIDYVAHEMGHQFGGDHTFNGSTGSCVQRSSSAAQEPGSGITIMAYAGICGAEDLALHSIDTFAVKSIEQILAFATGATGNSCAAATATGNSLPNVIGPGNFTIPAQTPFSLTASATDANNDTLTYDWQEYDFGAVSPPNTDSDGQARPLFRNYVPTTSGTRYFPSLPYILNNANVPPATYNCSRATPCLTGEILSTMNRTMVFQVVVRDNRSNAGGINTATSQVTITNLRGPFVLTAPNTAVSVTGGSSLNVTWAVNDTTLTPVNAANVDILLSTDGGLTFPTILLASTPNDGSQSVTIPNTPTANARIKIRGTGNIFFDISDVNFTILASTVTVSGQVFGFGSRPVKGASVNITGPGVNTTITTTSRGTYAFANIPAGQTYTITAANRRYSYTPQTAMNISSNLSGVNFIPN